MLIKRNHRVWKGGVVEVEGGECRLGRVANVDPKARKGHPTEGGRGSGVCCLSQQKPNTATGGSWRRCRGMLAGDKQVGPPGIDD